MGGRRRGLRRTPRGRGPDAGRLGDLKVDIERDLGSNVKLVVLDTDDAAVDEVAEENIDICEIDCTFYLWGLISSQVLLHRHYWYRI